MTPYTQAWCGDEPPYSPIQAHTTWVRCMAEYANVQEMPGTTLRPQGEPIVWSQPSYHNWYDSIWAGDWSFSHYVVIVALVIGTLFTVLYIVGRIDKHHASKRVHTEAETLIIPSQPSDAQAWSEEYPRS